MIRNIRAAMIVGLAVATSSTLGFAQSVRLRRRLWQDKARRQLCAADQKPTKEQLAKLFEVMRMKVQMQSMRQIVPRMVQQQLNSAMKQTEADLPPGTKLTPEQREGMEQVMSKYVGKAMDLYPATRCSRI